VCGFVLCVRRVKCREERAPLACVSYLYLFFSTRDRKKNKKTERERGVCESAGVRRVACSVYESAGVRRVACSVCEAESVGVSCVGFFLLLYFFFLERSRKRRRRACADGRVAESVRACAGVSVRGRAGVLCGQDGCCVLYFIRNNNAFFFFIFFSQHLAEKRIELQSLRIEKAKATVADTAGGEENLTDYDDTQTQTIPDGEIIKNC
jgi:hypothetical protein